MKRVSTPAIDVVGLALDTAVTTCGFVFRKVAPNVWTDGDMTVDTDWIITHCTPDPCPVDVERFVHVWMTK